MIPFTGVVASRPFVKHGQARVTPPITVLGRTLVAFVNDGCPSQAAALAYYTVFSIPPLLLIFITVVGESFGSQAVEDRVLAEVRALVGVRAAGQIASILTAIQKSDRPHGFAAALGVLALVFAATSAFVQLQSALNQAWGVKPDPRQSEIRNFFIKRLISFGMILAMAFLMLVSLLVSAALSAFSDVLAVLTVPGFSPTVTQALNTGFSLVLFAFIFAAMHGFLPDAKISWKDAMVGGIATALLFTGGKVLIGLYVGNSDVTDVYGAAGSLAVILLWTYYSSIVVLLGAEFTKNWSWRHGRLPQPEQGAIKVRHQEIRTG
jgi:membrane protein